MLALPNALTPAQSTLEEQLELFNSTLGELALEGFVQNEAVIISVPPERIRDVVAAMRDDPKCAMDVLCFITAVDYTPRNPRFDVVYQLYSLRERHRCRIRTRLADTETEEVLPAIDSVADIYFAADWHERECYDLFGISFVGHPDLRRIVLPDRWDGYPLRRDYPFDGKRVWNVGTTVVDSVEADVNLGL